MRTITKLLAAASLMATGAALAHTSSLGYVPGAVAGSIVLWTGSYEHGGTPVLEGIGTLTGVDVVYNATVPFAIGPVSAKPAGLVDGVNNFFWKEDGLGGYTFPNNVDPIIFGLGISHWQGVSFTGLVAGTYDFTCGDTCGITAQWASLSTAGGQTGTVRFTLKNGDINPGVPEPATWGLMIAGFGLVGTVMRSRARRGLTIA